jgi:hypothetical protein
VARAVDVDRDVRGRRLPGFAIGRGNVVHDLDVLGRASHRLRVEQIALRDADAFAFETRLSRDCAGGRARAPRVRGAQRDGQVPAREARGSGDEHIHEVRGMRLIVLPLLH